MASREDGSSRQAVGPAGPELLPVAGQRAPARVRRLGMRDCAAVQAAMRHFTETRSADTSDEIWLVEHEPVFTLGQAGRPEHVLCPGDIPILHVDRGGQVTYHGPGQLVIYLLADLRRRKIGVRRLVSTLEQAVIDMLGGLKIVSGRRRGAPGVYVDGKKIAALGLRIRGGCCYHGLALNVDMDLRPFQRIDPCGYPGLEVTQLRDLGVAMSVLEAGRKLLPHLAAGLGYALHGSAASRWEPPAG